MWWICEFNVISAIPYAWLIYPTGGQGSCRDYAKRDSGVATTWRCCVTTFRLYGSKMDSKFSVHSDILITKLIYLDTLLFFLLLSRFASRSEANIECTLNFESVFLPYTTELFTVSRTTDLQRRNFSPRDFVFVPLFGNCFFFLNCYNDPFNIPTIMYFVAVNYSYYLLWNR